MITLNHDAQIRGATLLSLIATIKASEATARKAYSEFCAGRDPETYGALAQDADTRAECARHQIAALIERAFPGCTADEIRKALP